ncbi:MAG: biotin-dependent carboxyltransferase family protein [Thermodesulfobacteriota bacterium]
MKAFRVINPGIQTTVQDLGRSGLMKYGIPKSGAMDRRSFVIANLLLRNPDNAAALETTLQGLKLQALKKVTISITGADLDPWLNDQPSPQWTAFTMKEGDVLHLKKRNKGLRAYVAVQGGFDVPEVLGSRSTFVRGRIGAILHEGEILSMCPFNSEAAGNVLTVPQEYWPDFGRTDPIRVLIGPQEDYFTPQGIDTFLSSTYRISPQFDRQAFRTEGPAIEIAKGPGIITDPIPQGAIQVPGDGKPVILLRDAQVTGGYAKIAIVSRVEMDFLGQMMPGDTIRFQRIDLQTAIDLLYEETHCLDKLRDLLR